MLTITLRQEIIDGHGDAVKQIICFSASPGRPDTQMYDVRLNQESRSPEIRINRNNILSITEIARHDIGKAHY